MSVKVVSGVFRPDNPPHQFEGATPVVSGLAQKNRLLHREDPHRSFPAFNEHCGLEAMERTFQVICRAARSSGKILTRSLFIRDEEMIHPPVQFFLFHEYSFLPERRY